MHVDNATQASKAQTAEDEVPEDLPQDPPAEVLQTIEENQEIPEREGVTLATNDDQVTNTQRHTISLKHWFCL